ncbi:hypothetical protein EIP86_006575 [Pleurotus ostreatoroseus]|nr:hypothetical protein EIP86_006575 [Pleurotus ostreatoroseus]
MVRCSNRLSSEISKRLPKLNFLHHSGHAAPGTTPILNTKDGDLVSDSLVNRSGAFNDLSDDRINVRILQQLMSAEDLSPSPQPMATVQSPTLDNSPGGTTEHNVASAENPVPSQPIASVRAPMPDSSSGGTSEDNTNLLIEEEDQLVSIENNDLVVFRHIDISFFDDNLLTLTQKSLQLQPRPLRPTLEFVTRIFQSRLGFHLPGSTTQPDLPQRLLWPSTLSQVARVALAEIIADSMAYELIHNRPTGYTRLSMTNSIWSSSFIFIILLVTPCEIPSGVHHLIQVIAQDFDPTSEWSPLDDFAYQMRTLRQHDSTWPTRSLMFFSRSLDLIKAIKAENCLSYITFASFLGQSHVALLLWDYQHLLQLATSQPKPSAGDDVIPLTLQTTVVLLDMARVILHKYTLEQTDTEYKYKFPSHISDLLEFVLGAILFIKKRRLDVERHKPRTPTASDEPGLYQVLADLFTTSHTTHSLLDFFIKGHLQLLIPTNISRPDWSFSDLMGNVQCSRERNILTLRTCASFFSTNANRIDKQELMSLCYFIYMLNTENDDETRASWHRMFVAAAACFTGDEPKTCGPRTECSPETYRSRQRMT